MENRRVVITGRGVCLPNANNNPDNVDVMMNNLYNGRSSIENVSSRFTWLEGYRSQAGSLFNDFKFNYEKFGMKEKDVRALSPFVQYFLEACYQAVNESGFLDLGDSVRDMTGVCVGQGLIGIIELEEQKTIQMNIPKIMKCKSIEEIKELLGKGISRVSPLVCPKTIADSACGLAANQWELHGPNKAVARACASGAEGLIDAYNAIIVGDAIVMLGGGTVEAASSMIYASFGQPRALSQRNNDSLHASRPFDRDRDGFVIGEGAGVAVLEELEHAKARGANILGELLGYGSTNDAYHMTKPRPDAKYITMAMETAIKRAGINKEQIKYINAHGTSTPDGDGIECFGIKKVFGERAYKIPVNSTKSMIGHTLSAAGAIELIVALETVRNGKIHPTVNCENPDTDVKYHTDFKEEQIRTFQPCDLDYVREGAREINIDYALSNSFGFFGNNASLVVGRYKDK